MCAENDSSGAGVEMQLFDSLPGIIRPICSTGNPMSKNRKSDQIDPHAETIDLSRKKSRYFHSDSVIPAGEFFASYKIKKLISRGSMGMVYLAHQPKLNRDVALKILLGSEYASEEQIMRFEREAQTVARLKHPNIVPIFDIGVYKEKNFFTMEYIEGSPLNEVIRSGKLLFREALEIAKQVGRGLQAAHEAGIIHRDIKPANILLDKDGKAMITDFGLAKWIDSNTRFTRTGVAIGTPSYMSPEQAYGAADIDPLTDVYSLGAVLYEMVTFKPPFTGNTHMEIIISVLNKKPAPPRRLNPRINRDIEIIIQKSMEKEPSLRYRNARAMADDLQRFIDGEAITARPTSIIIKGIKKVRKHKTFAAVVGSLITVLVVILLWSLFLWKEKVRLEKRQKVRDRELKIAQKQFETMGEEKVINRFIDKFNADTLDKKKWDPRNHGKHWKIESGLLVGVPAGKNASFLWCRNTVQSNMNLTTELEVSGKNPGVRLFFGNDRGRKLNGYSVSLSKKGITLSRVYRGAWSRPVLAQNTMDIIKENVPFKLTIVFSRYSMRVAVDDTPVIDYKNFEIIEELEKLEPIHPVLVVESGAVSIRNLGIENYIPSAMEGFFQAGDILLKDAKYKSAYMEFKQRYLGYESDKNKAASLLKIKALFRMGMTYDRYGHVQRNRDQREKILKEAVENYSRAIRAVTAMDRSLKQEKNTKIARELKTIKEDCIVRKFFCEYSLGGFVSAVENLKKHWNRSESIETAWIWYFPPAIINVVKTKYQKVAQGKEVYSAALQLGKMLKFPAKDNSVLRLSELVSLLATQFIQVDDCENAIASFDIFPNRTFINVVVSGLNHFMKKKDFDSAFKLVRFSVSRGAVFIEKDTAKVKPLAVRVGNGFCDKQEYGKLKKTFTTLPCPGFLAVFHKAVTKMVSKKDFSAGLDMFAFIAGNTEHFEREKVVAVATDVSKQLVAAGQYTDVLKVCGLYFEEKYAFKTMCDAMMTAIQKKAYTDAVTIGDAIREKFEERDNRISDFFKTISNELLTQKKEELIVDLYKDDVNSRSVNIIFKGIMQKLSRNEIREAVQMYKNVWINARWNQDSREHIQQIAYTLSRNLLEKKSFDLMRSLYDNEFRKIDDRSVIEKTNIYLYLSKLKDAEKILKAVLRDATSAQYESQNKLNLVKLLMVQMALGQENNIAFMLSTYDTESMYFNPGERTEENKEVMAYLQGDIIAFDKKPGTNEYLKQFLVIREKEERPSILKEEERQELVKGYRNLAGKKHWIRGLALHRLKELLPTPIPGNRTTPSSESDEKGTAAAASTNNKKDSAKPKPVKKVAPKK